MIVILPVDFFGGDKIHVTLSKLISLAGLTFKEHFAVLQLYHHVTVPNTVYFTGHISVLLLWATE